MKNPDRNREITERYCPHVDDNIVVSKNAADNSYECLCTHLCSERADIECSRRPKTKKERE